MKAEHRDIIARAAESDLMPSELASELLQHDLINTCLRQLRQLPSAWAKLSESQQQKIIDELESTVADACESAVRIISSAGRTEVAVKLKTITVDAGLKAVVAVEHDTPHKHALIDAANSMCLLVIAPNSYDAAKDAFKPEKDQPDLPIDEPGQDEGSFESDVQAAETGSVYELAKQFVIEKGKPTVSAIQRKFKIPFADAQDILLKLEAEGVVTEPNTNGVREVIHGAYVPPTQQETHLIME